MVDKQLYFAMLVCSVVGGFLGSLFGLGISSMDRKYTTNNLSGFISLSCETFEVAKKESDEKEKIISIYPVLSEISAHHLISEMAGKRIGLSKCLGNIK